MRARFGGRAYARHRHDTYAIGLTVSGVQRFGYRGTTHTSLPGEVQVLHPDEAHDGYAGTEAGFGYRLVYVDPALIFEAVRQVSAGPPALPFVRQPVVRSPLLAAAVWDAFSDTPEPLAIDDLAARLADGLLAADPGSGHLTRPRVDLAAVERARQFLDAETARVVRSSELETVTGLTRYDLARQFRGVVGTSPYRYSLMRRLAAARGLIASGRRLVEVARVVGFADQAHFTRMFTAAYGITPARYAQLNSADRA